MVIKKYIKEYSLKEKYRELPLKGHKLYCESLEMYRDSRFSVA